MTMYKIEMELTDAGFADAAEVEATLTTLVEQFKQEKTGAGLKLTRFSPSRQPKKPTAKPKP